MKKIAADSQKIYFFLTILLTLILTIPLSVSTYYINYWPTDSENPYIPVASKLFELPFVSMMHNVPVGGMLRIIMHGKETLIIGIAIFQRLLNDYISLYPNVLLLILAIGLSAILIYQILKNYFGANIGFIGYLLFAGSFWPYLYILQGAHPPLVLFNFLLALFLLQKSRHNQAFSFLSGIVLGLMIFSSPMSPLYLPYYLAAFLYQETNPKNHELNLKRTALKGFLILGGALSIFLYFTIPHPILNMKTTLHFLEFSQYGNNFALFQNYLKRFFPIPESLRGAGWLWIIKYFFLIMPMLFLAYLVSIFWFLKESSKKPFLLLIILISFSTPLAVEASGVAQFGRNYFSWFVAIIFVVCYALNSLKNQMAKSIGIKHKKIFIGVWAVFLISYVAVNAFIFLNDVLPSRLASTNIYTWLIKHRINQVSIYEYHPLNPNFIYFMNNPKFTNKIYFETMNSIRDVKKGAILVLPITGKTILQECRLNDFKNDPALTELYESGYFKKFVVAKFKTMASSRIWNQEEEICTYRDLILGHMAYQERQKGFAWILDAEKLQKEWFSKK